jgi:hypothetical protein
MPGDPYVKVHGLLLIKELEAITASDPSPAPNCLPGGDAAQVVQAVEMLRLR